MECATWQFRAAVRASYGYTLESASTSCDIGAKWFQTCFRKHYCQIHILMNCCNDLKSISYFLSSDLWTYSFVRNKVSVSFGHTKNESVWLQRFKISVVKLISWWFLLQVQMCWSDLCLLKSFWHLCLYCFTELTQVVSSSLSQTCCLKMKAQTLSCYHPLSEFSCQICLLFTRLEKSQTHRMIWLGRDLWRK